MWKLLGGLGLAFAFPWLLLVVLPYVDQSNAKPVAYAEEDEAGGYTAYPEAGVNQFGSSNYGAEVYAAEGCAYCHTQVIRPTYAGPDMWRPGWGGREEEGLARETRPRDFEGEPVAHLGYQRIGQDLSNVGYRVSSRAEMHRHLYDPKSFDPDSGMPAYRHLYRFDAGSGEAIPSGRAEALVDYLMSRRKDAPVPASLRR